MIYFDNAATSFPKPLNVKKSIEDYFCKYGGNPGRSGHNLAMKTAEMVFETRTKLKDMFGAGNEENIVFTQNCTDSANTVINGLLKKGDHVIISDIEHNAVARPVHRLARQGLITYDVAETFGNSDKTLKSIESHIKKNTKLIITVHGSNLLASVLPIRKIGDLCHKKNIFYMVDAAQTAGVLPLNFKEDNMDFLCIAPHKGLYAFTGIGVLITDKGELLRPARVGGSGSMSFSLDFPDFMPDRLEAGTINTAGILTLNAGIDFVNKIGTEKIYRKETELAKMLYDGISENKNIKIYSEKPEINRSVPMVSFNFGEIPSEELCKFLNEKGFCLRAGLHCTPLAHKKTGTFNYGCVRASVGAFNSKQEIIGLVKTINSFNSTKRHML